MEIKTSRLCLSPLGMEYLASTHEYSSDREATKYMVYLPDDTIEETARFLKNVDAEWSKVKPEFYEFAILFHEKHIGAISLYLEENGTVGELGWVIHRNYWNQGIATEAAKALLTYSEDVLGVHHFIAHCDSENIASYTVMEKIGMVRVQCSEGRKNKSSEELRKEYMYELNIERVNNHE